MICFCFYSRHLPLFLADPSYGQSYIMFYIHACIWMDEGPPPKSYPLSDSSTGKKKNFTLIKSRHSAKPIKISVMRVPYFETRGH